MTGSMDSLQQLVGDEVAGFKLTAWLGEGGMAAVFRGENVLNPAIVRAIKIVHRELSTRKEFATRFSQEAVFLERLRHPNVVRFYGLRHDKRPTGDLLMMELELLEGESLADFSTRTRVAAPVRAAVGWVRQAAEGVAAAHALSIVHRDLKPENLFLTTTGELKVLDFGIARAYDEADRHERLTRAGTMPGSPAYMAPEVCQGAMPGAQADVYALGITLYELLAGYHPYCRPGAAMLSSTQLMMAQMTQPLTPLRDVRPDAPEIVEQVVSRATAKDPSWRYANAAELAAALATALQSIAGAEGRPEEGPAPPGTQFALPQLFAVRNSTPNATDARPRQPSQPDGSGSFRISAVPSHPRSQGGTDPTMRPSWGGGSLPGQTSSNGVVVGEGPAKKRSAIVVVPAVLLLVAAGGAAWWFLHGKQSDPGAAAVVANAATATPTATAAAAPAPQEKNRWVLVTPPPHDKPWLLGLDSAGSDEERGFRPERKIAAPRAAFEIQQHEVTWGELDAWLDTHAERRFERPAWVPGDPGGREKLPATGVSWDVAREYCKSIAGTLPTEEQWEFAARGADRRAYGWGDKSVDLAMTHAYVGDAPKEGWATPPVTEVMTSDQDITASEPPIYDMMGNAEEWTQDLFREDTKSDERWVQAGGMTWRALRGLPLAEKPPASFPTVGAAYRSPGCATGECPPAAAEIRQYVGFRCIRPARQ
jgi:eukaryotic-like serine/threonine-protein kinase